MHTTHTQHKHHYKWQLQQRQTTFAKIVYWQGCLLFVAHTPFLFHPENILHRQHTMLINMRNKSGQSILPCHNINYLYPQIIDCSSHIIQINVQTFLPWNEPNLIQTCQNHQHRLDLRHLKPPLWLRMFFKPKPTHTVYMSDTDKTLVLYTSPWAVVRFVLPNLCWIVAAVVSAGLIYREFAHHPFAEETRKYWLELFVFAWSATFGCAALLKTCALLYVWPRFYTQIQLSPQGLRLQHWQHKQHFSTWTPSPLTGRIPYW